MVFNEYTIDLILIAVILISIIIGRIRGFAAMMLGLAASIGCILLAKEFAAPAGQWINDNIIHENLVSFISGTLNDNISAGTQAAVSSIPQYITSAAEACGLSLQTMIENAASSADISQISLKLAAAAETAISPLLSTVGFVAVFMICRVLSGIAITVVSFLCKLPVIKTVDKLLGGITGAVKGIIFFIILCIIFTVCSELFSGTPFGDAIKSSTLVRLFGQAVNLLLSK